MTPFRPLIPCLTPAIIRPCLLHRRTLTTLKIDPDQLMNDIHHTAQWGTGPAWGSHPTETGVSRLTLTSADKSARDWFHKTCTSLGCNVTVDSMGNQFAIRPSSKHPNAPPTAAGSHLDTQPLGGRYDGILGVTAGISLLRALHTTNTTTHHPIAVVNWTNEEGARFPISMVSSGVWAGAIPQSTAYGLRSVVPGEESQTMESELTRIDAMGVTPASYTSLPLAAHFELHIEQGPLLENSGKRIGVVTGVQSYAWNTLTITGRATHTGTTDLNSRSDALLAAAKMVVAARRIAREEGGLATVGILEARPGAVNTVPGSVRMSLDVRGRTNEVRAKLMDRLRGEFDAMAAGRGDDGDKVGLEWRLDSLSESVSFHEDNIRCVREAAQGVVGDEVMDMVSGAGHDSVYTSRVCPTSMVFVPCRGGVSHNPEEFCAPEDCVRGAQVLSDAVLRYDELRASRG